MQEIRGVNYIGSRAVKGTDASFRAFCPAEGKWLEEVFYSADYKLIDDAARLAHQAFDTFRFKSPEQRANFLEAIAEEIEDCGDDLIHRANLETGLPRPRLTGERGRTVGQLRFFAGIIREASWVEATIDTALPERTPLPRPDIRKMLLPVGPVAVFGASNFPLAFSTAGGDTASALAAGNPVIVKGHPGHPGTNEMVSGAIIRAAQRTGMPEGVFSMIVGNQPQTSIQLVQNKYIKAVGFTGSYGAGMSISSAIQQRGEIIPLYAEMGSINPVLIFPGALSEDGAAIASMVAQSVTLGVGQFCTNPGLIILLKDQYSEVFIKHLNDQLSTIPGGVMLNQGVCRSYYKGRNHLSAHDAVQKLHVGSQEEDVCIGYPTLLSVEARDFVRDNLFREEVFGPSTLLVLCDNEEEMISAINSCPGQLTGTVMGRKEELIKYSPCVEALKIRVGRLIFNGVPTGVEVCHAMVHGGPFPATTHSHFTSVGADAIKRFTRPVCYQDWPQELLPEELKDGNPWGIMRKWNGVFGRE
ncbi:MAG: aldehyde dehydrogenase (NADP(+)) [Saprospiraceae bacterium]|nr:aldehyde dehydrogenase (NADP(+)) [Saprospiraceae bacterium]